MPGTIEEAIVHVAFQFAAKEGVLLGSPTALVEYLTSEGILPLEKIGKFTYQRLCEFCDEYQRMVSVHKDGAGPSSSPVARARPNRDAPDAMSVESSDSAYESYTTSWLEKTEDCDLVIRLYLHPNDPQARGKPFNGKFRREKGSLITSRAAERYGGEREGQRMRVHFKTVVPSGEYISGTTWCTIRDLDEEEQPDIILCIDCLHQSQVGDNEGDIFENKPHMQDQPGVNISKRRKRIMAELVVEVSGVLEREENASKRPRMELPPDG